MKIGQMISRARAWVDFNISDRFNAAVASLAVAHVAMDGGDLVQASRLMREYIWIWCEFVRRVRDALLLIGVMTVLYVLIKGWPIPAGAWCGWGTAAVMWHVGKFWWNYRRRFHRRG